MKRLIASLVAGLGLAGCVAVPYGGYSEPGGYYYAPAVPAVSFGYSYYGGGYHHGHRRYR